MFAIRSQKGHGSHWVKAELLARGFTDHVDTGTSVDVATVKVASLDDDFNRGVLVIHEGWSSPWLAQVNGG